VVDNKAGEVIHLAEFQPECSGEWGYPGMDVWRVEQGQAVSKVCGTPWNRPQNMAIKVVVIAIAAVFGFFIIMMLSNELRKMKKERELKNMRSSRQLMAPPQSAMQYPSRTATSSDQVAGFIRLLGQHDKGLAEELLKFRQEHRRELVGVHTIEGFADVVMQINPSLYKKVESAVETAEPRRR